MLRAPDALFHTNGPILTDENTKSKYLIDMQLFQPSDIGGGGEDNEGIPSRLFRMEITSATYDKSVKGEHVTLQLTNIDIRLEELLDGERLELTTPKQAFIERVLNAGEARIDEGPLFIIIDFGDTSLDLPDEPRLKQDWIPTKPTPIKVLLDEIIDRISKPEKIGTLNRDYYWFSIISPTSTFQVTLTAKQFGETDSGVILKDSDLTTPSDQLEFHKQTGINNNKFKNLLIGRGKNGVHTFPMDFTRHTSDLTHAKIADFWSVLSIDYIEGDYVKFGNEYFKCLVDNESNAGNAPNIAPFIWKNLSTSLDGSPWTLDPEVWIKNLAGHSNPPAGFVGFFNDMNISYANYDRNDEFNEFEKVSVKDIEDYIDDPSTILTDELQNGRRWLVKNGVGDWEGENRKIAARNNNEWVFSIAPVNDDIVNDLKLGKVRKFDGANWIIAWDIDVNPELASTFHPVESITLVNNRRNLPKAIRFRFNWNTFDVVGIAQDLSNFLNLQNPTGQLINLLGQAVSNYTGTTGEDLLDFLGLADNTDLITAFGVGNNKNRAGRWCGWSIKAPFPRNATGTKAVGHFIKKPQIDFENLHSTINNDTIGWNQGKATEDLGGIRGLRYWVRNTFYDKNDLPINGMADIPYIHWWRDISDRIAYSETKIPAHDKPQKISVPAGPKANLKLHDTRIDELFKLFGFTFPDNYFITERELTGVKFDWRRVKEFGCFYKGSYDENFFYRAAQQSYIDNFTEHMTQLFKNTLTGATFGVIDEETVVVDHVDYIIDDIHFLKDAFVTSSNTPVTDLRQQVIDMPNQFDYINIKSSLDKLLSRRQFHPGKHTIDCRGDVRLQVGKFFTINDTSVITPIQVTPIKVSHIDDVNGYNVQISGVFKYEVPVE